MRSPLGSSITGLRERRVNVMLQDLGKDVAFSMSTGEIPERGEQRKELPWSRDLSPAVPRVVTVDARNAEQDLKLARLSDAQPYGQYSSINLTGGRREVYIRRR